MTTKISNAVMTAQVENTEMGSMSNEQVINKAKKVKKVKKTYNEDFITDYEVEFADGTFTEVRVWKNNAWNYTIVDKNKRQEITYNDDFNYHFRSLKRTGEMIERFENEIAAKAAEISQEVENEGLALREAIVANYIEVMAEDLKRSVENLSVSISEKEKKDKYFKPKEVKLSISESDFDILMYAFYNVDWSGYRKEDFNGEDDMAAIGHLCDIEDQLRESF